MPQWMEWMVGLLFLVAVLVIAWLVAKAQRQQSRTEAIEKQLGIAVVPFWSMAVKVAAELLIHEGEEFQEADDLIAEALLEPKLKMKEHRLTRLDELMVERKTDESDYIRPGEVEAAGLLPYAIRMARIESANQVALSGFTVVGRHAPEDQVSGEEPKLV